MSCFSFSILKNSICPYSQSFICGAQLNLLQIDAHCEHTIKVYWVKSVVHLSCSSADPNNQFNLTRSDRQSKQARYYYLYPTWDGYIRYWRQFTIGRIADLDKKAQKRVRLVIRNLPGISFNISGRAKNKFFVSRLASSCLTRHFGTLSKCFSFP